MSIEAMRAARESLHECLTHFSVYGHKLLQEGRIKHDPLKAISALDAAIKAAEAGQPNGAVLRCNKCGSETSIKFSYSAPAQPSPEPPFGNCRFAACDLPGQCKAEGRCHHPKAEPPSEPQGAQISDEKRCPFCNEGEFDSIGLKGHLQQEDCEEYTNLTAPPRPFALLREAPAGWRPIESAPKE